MERSIDNYSDTIVEKFNNSMVMFYLNNGYCRFIVICSAVTHPFEIHNVLVISK